MGVGKRAGETGNVELRRIPLTSVQKTTGETPKRNELARIVKMDDVPVATTVDGREGDEPTAPGLVRTPVVTSVETRIYSRKRRTLKTPMMAGEMEGTTGEGDGDGE